MFKLTLSFLVLGYLLVLLDFVQPYPYSPIEEMLLGSENSICGEITRPAEPCPYGESIDACGNITCRAGPAEPCSKKKICAETLSCDGRCQICTGCSTNNINKRYYCTPEDTKTLVDSGCKPPLYERHISFTRVSGPEPRSFYKG